MSTINQAKVNFVTGNAEKISFPDSYFDRVVSTCLLHHVNDPLAVLLESRRVVSNGGEVAFILPADPGMLNRLIKLLITYPRIRKNSSFDPRLIYALEHPNKIDSLLALLKFVFEKDDYKIKYYPFKVPSWNLNLAITFHARINKVD